MFGVSSDEFLNNAISNRNQWELVGEEVVAEYLEKYKAGGNKPEKPRRKSRSLFIDNDDDDDEEEQKKPAQSAPSRKSRSLLMDDA